MSATATAIEDHDVARKRLAHAARYRGTLEADIVFRRFCERHLAELNDDELGQFERLLAEPDQESWAWITEQRPAPARHDNAVLGRLRDCRAHDAMRAPRR